MQGAVQTGGDCAGDSLVKRSRVVVLFGEDVFANQLCRALVFCGGVAGLGSSAPRSLTLHSSGIVLRQTDRREGEVIIVRVTKHSP